LLFAAQSANAAKYSVEAAAQGYATLSSAIDLSTTNATVNFTLVPTP
jgi:hypothetical protein